MLPHLCHLYFGAKRINKNVYMSLVVSLLPQWVGWRVKSLLERRTDSRVCRRVLWVECSAVTTTGVDMHSLLHSLQSGPVQCRAVQSAGVRPVQSVTSHRVAVCQKSLPTDPFVLRLFVVLSTWYNDLSTFFSVCLPAGLSLYLFHCLCPLSQNGLLCLYLHWKYVNKIQKQRNY